MTTYWDKTALVRAGLDATSTATSLGFTAARLGTRLGFSATRGIASVAGSAVDHTFFGGRTGAPGAALSGTIASALTLTERIALLPLALGEGLTCGALGAVQALLPDADGALAAFVALVRRERAEPVFKERLPPRADSLGTTEIARALAAWAVLQAFTAGWKEQEWLQHMREIGLANVDAEVPRVRVGTDMSASPARRTRRRALSMHTDDERKAEVRRFGKLVLAGVLGAPQRTGGTKASEEKIAAMDSAPNSAWYDVLLGKPDAGAGAAVGTPRFWVLVDRARREVVLVVRGTLSLDALACTPAPFRPARTDNADTAGMPGYARFEAGGDGPTYMVHEGMLRMARTLGEPGKPMHTAVRDALRKHKSYDLVLCGHSLGAGVATLLGLTWADPATCRTIAASGLPVGRRVAVYAFAPPCVCDAALGAAARGMVTSLVCGLDAVARLSLGSVRDLTRAAAWLCAEDAGSVLTRAVRHRAGLGRTEDTDWFLATRKTLEANMHLAELFPPGRVWWAIRNDALHPSNRRPEAPAVRLFEVHDVEKVFGQVVFAGDMLSSHLPHRYDAVIDELM